MGGIDEGEGPHGQIRDSKQTKGASQLIRACEAKHVVDTTCGHIAKKRRTPVKFSSPRRLLSHSQAYSILHPCSKELAITSVVGSVGFSRVIIGLFIPQAQARRPQPSLYQSTTSALFFGIPLHLVFQILSSFFPAMVPTAFCVRSLKSRMPLIMLRSCINDRWIRS